MYIEQAQKNLSHWWRYVIGLGIALIGISIFSIPHIVAILYKTATGDLDMNKSAANDVAYLMGLFESNLNLLFILLPFAGGLIFLLLTVLIIHNQSITNLTTSRTKIDWSRVAFAFILWGTVSTGMAMLDIYFSPEDYIFNFELNRFLILAVVAICLVPLQTSFEEYVFRGYLMQGIGNATRMKKSLYYVLLVLFCLVIYFSYANLGLPLIAALVIVIVFFIYITYSSFSEKFIDSELYEISYKLFSTYLTPLFITSIAFGLLHLSNPEVDKLGNIIMIYYIGTGFFLGILTLMDDGMELALGFHAANNLFIALLVTADWTALNTHSIYRSIGDPSEMSILEIIVPVFIIFPILLFIFSKKYNWNSWYDKLGPIKDISTSEEV